MRRTTILVTIGCPFKTSLIEGRDELDIPRYYHGNSAVRQEPVAGLLDFYKSWQKSLESFTKQKDNSAHSSVSPSQSVPDYLQVGRVISGQIFELLGKSAFPSHTEADLVSLSQLFVDFDAELNPQECQARLTQAREILYRLQASRHPESHSSAKRILATRASSRVEISIPSKIHSHSELWNLPIRFAKGVGPNRARLLEKLGVLTIEDAFWFLPWRYEDWSPIVPIAQLRSKLIATVRGHIISCRLRRTSRKGLAIITISIDDGTGILEAVFFNQPFLEQVFVPGTYLLLRGEVSTGNGRFGPLHMRAPQHELVQGQTETPGEMGRILPIYHETQGFTTRQFRRLMKGLLERNSSHLNEILPADILDKLQLPTLGSSVRTLHVPGHDQRIDQLNAGTTLAHQRLAFEELLLLQLALAVRRNMVNRESEGIAFAVTNPLVTKFRAHMPFSLTLAQERVIQEIEADMSAGTSMNRLLQGDVGSGKTLVALHAMVVACGSGYQAALMVPTEVLSEQHFLVIEPYLKHLGLTGVLVKGGQSARERTKILEQLATGDAQVVVGTHALLQPEVIFSKLGLVVVDEQHKFGVVQRGRLRKKGTHPPDVLVMTATPIPRTLAMTVYGDLDVSMIDTLPPGRKPVRTQLFRASERKNAYALLRREVKAGHQAFIVYPLVERSEKLDIQAASEAVETLQRDEFPELRVGLLHGRMKSREKQEVMAGFTKGEIHILVATTVIEVGVDVSNATIILIEHAERFGLAQLHQLRGRVGRGAAQAQCLLIQSAVNPVGHQSIEVAPKEFSLPFKPKLSGGGQDSCQEAIEYQNISHRLDVFVRCVDGFALAEEDLKIRGPGNVLGVQQWGSVNFRVAQLLRDRQLLIRAKGLASQLVEKDPELESKELRGLKEAMLRKWSKTFELSNIG